MADPKLLEILRVLDAQHVDLIVVGGMAAVIGGAPVITHDLDLLRRRSPQNIAGLLAALEQLDAVFRGDAQRLRPNASHLNGPGHLLLETRFGQLDLLGSIENDTSYEDLLPDTYEVAIEELTVRVVTLERLLVIKRQLARPKDRLMALQIEATIEELSKKS